MRPAVRGVMHECGVRRKARPATMMKVRADRYGPWPRGDLRASVG